MKDAIPRKRRLAAILCAAGAHACSSVTLSGAIAALALGSRAPSGSAAVQSI